MAQAAHRKPACLPEQLLCSADAVPPARASACADGWCSGQCVPQASAVGVEPGRPQHALDAGDMRRLAAVRRAGERELLVAEAVAVGAARLDQHQRLQRLDGRARKDRRRDVAERQHGRAVGVDHRHGAAVAALDQVAARHFDQDRIGHRAVASEPGCRHICASTDSLHFARHGHPPQDASQDASNHLLVVFALPIAARGGLYAVADHPRSWRDANWSSTHLLPPADQDRQARVLVFAARAGGWKSVFAVHTWVVVKPENATAYTRYDVMGFGQPVRVNMHAPDAYWFGDRPRLVADVRGARAAAAIPKIEAAVKSYPYATWGSYRVWPGPNSNTFTATLLRAAPELDSRDAVRGGRTRFPRRRLPGRPDRQPHRRRAQPLWPARREARLGRGRRGQLARPGRRARRPAAGAEDPGLRPARAG